MPSSLARSWWVIVLRGCCALVFGIATLALPQMTLVALVLVFGAYAFADGLLSIVAAGRALSQERTWWPMLAEGIVGLGIGVLTFFWPGLTALTLLYLIAVWALVTGILEIVAALRLRHEITGEWLLVVAGVLSIVFGLYVLANPIAGVLAVLAIIGIYALVFGGALIALGLRLRSLSLSQRSSALP